MSVNQKKVLWPFVKSAIKQDISTRKLKDNSIRLNAIERVDDLLHKYCPKEYNDPVRLLNIEKNELFKKLGKYKTGGELNSSEKSIINNIYEYLKNQLIIMESDSDKELDSVKEV